MTPPKKIYLYPDVGNRNLVKTWFEQQMTKDCLPYYSEEHIRETLKQVVDDANRLIEASTTIHKIKIDANKYIPHVIELMLKGASDD